nr:hypothetical protein [Nocardiopsis sp. Huas11]
MDALTHAREAFNQTGDIHGEAQAWNNLGAAQVELGQRAGAVGAVLRAVDLFEAAGDEHNAALGRESLVRIRQDPDTDDLV